MGENMFGSTFNDVVTCINRWKPKEKYSTENQYRNDLIEVLRLELNEKQSPLGLQQQRISITKDDGRGLCDIGVAKKVGIELKKDLNSKSQIDRLAGQVMDYKEDYEDIIIVLVGDTNKDAYELLKDKIAQLSKSSGGIVLYQEPKIKVINKCFGAKESESPKRPFWDMGI